MIRLTATDFTDVGAVLLSDGEIDMLAKTPVTVFAIPVFLVRTAMDRERVISYPLVQIEYEGLRYITGILDADLLKQDFYAHCIEEAILKYEQRLLLPFFSALRRYVAKGNLQFDCPGH